MKKVLLGLAALGLATLAAPAPATARVFIGLPGFSLFTGPPVVAAPPPALYAPPVYYRHRRPYVPVYYGRPYRPVYVPYWGPGKRKGWYKHHHKHGRW